MMKRRIILFVYLITGLGLIALSLQCQTKKKGNEAANVRTWMNLGDSAHYVGISTCKGCHIDVYNSFKQTGMGQSFGAATMEKSAADWHEKKPVYDKYKDLYYQPYWKNDTSLFVKEYRLKGGDTVYSREERISYIIGSGHHTNSHIINTNGYLTQAPFTWFAQKAQWDLPPGFEGGYNSRFSRELGNECMTCHNAYPTPVAGSLNKYSYVPSGIDCERCHGPGSIHVAQKQKGIIVDIGRDTDFSIVNPAKVPYTLQIDICQRCHMQGNAVLKPGKSFYDFRPGMRLSQVVDVFMPLYENQEHGFLMASHPERLRKSPCFIGTHKPGSSLKALTCITCHNPHVSVKLTKDEYFIAKCMDCHPSAHAKTKEILQTKGQNCLSCHMPKSGAVDIPHVTITDHNIRMVRNNELKNAVVGTGAFEGLMDMTDSMPSPLVRAKGYMYFYEKFEHKPVFLDSAWRFLNQYQPSQQPEGYIYYFYLKGDWQKTVSVASLRKGTFNEAVINYQVAQSYMNLNRNQEALPYMKAAVQLMPYQLDYRLKLGTNYLLLRNIEEAKKQFEFVIKEDPKFEAAWNNLGFIELLNGNAGAAMKNLEKSLALNPDYTPAKINQAKVWLAKNDIDKAKNILLDILKAEPGNTDARQLLALINQSSSFYR